MTEELTPRQAAERIGTTTRTVQRWIEAGRLPARRVGGRLRVASVALDALGQGPTPSRSTSAEPPGPIRRVFVANRGEIGRRIRTTVERLGGLAFVPGENDV